MGKRDSLQSIKRQTTLKLSLLQEQTKWLQSPPPPCFLKAFVEMGTGDLGPVPPPSLILQTMQQQQHTNTDLSYTKKKFCQERWRNWKKATPTPSCYTEWQLHENMHSAAAPAVLGFFSRALTRTFGRKELSLLRQQRRHENRDWQEQSSCNFHIIAVKLFSPFFFGSPPSSSALSSLLWPTNGVTSSPSNQGYLLPAPQCCKQSNYYPSKGRIFRPSNPPSIKTSSAESMTMSETTPPLSAL